MKMAAAFLFDADDSCFLLLDRGGTRNTEWGGRCATLTALPHFSVGRFEVRCEPCAVEQWVSIAIALEPGANLRKSRAVRREVCGQRFVVCEIRRDEFGQIEDRKSTRLNSSH